MDGVGLADVDVTSTVSRIMLIVLIFILIHTTGDDASLIPNWMHGAASD